MLTTPTPFAAAIDDLQRRQLLPTTANTAQLQQLPAALRDSSLFSAKVNDARLLQDIREQLAGIVQPEGHAPGSSLNTASARETLRAVLSGMGYAPEAGKEGSIEDLSSRARLDLIIDHNVSAARNRGNWSAGQDPAVLDMWPCQELIRVYASRAPRNWRARWRAAGGQLYGGRMIARKDSPVWIAISRFGTPYPPFDFNSGMDVADVDRDEAISMGVIPADATVPPQDAPPLAISAPVSHIADFLLEQVMKVLGPKASVSYGSLTFGP